MDEPSYKEDLNELPEVKVEGNVKNLKAIFIQTQTWGQYLLRDWLCNYGFERSSEVLVWRGTAVENKSRQESAS